jgi:hypothetical protein
VTTEEEYLERAYRAKCRRFNTTFDWHPRRLDPQRESDTGSREDEG